MSSTGRHHNGIDSRPLYESVYQRSNTSPEKRLWSAVLLTFMHDVQKDYWEYRESLNGQSRKLRKKLDEHVEVAKAERCEIICGLVEIEHTCFVEKIEAISLGTFEVDVVSIHS